MAASPDAEPRIAFSSRSLWDSTNPWLNGDAVVEWNPETADILFLGGNDWRALTPSQRKSFAKPIINLIQHPRHAEPGSELRSFLSHLAVRICVSEEVASAIKATNEVNGPVFTIPNGVDSSCFPTRPKDISERATDLLICGLKAPDLSRDCYRQLSGKHGLVRWMIDWAPRDEFLKRMADAKVVLLLPRPEEGFYLPALEAMGSGSVVVCPDCVGNRSFCLDEVNSFRPKSTTSTRSLRLPSGRFDWIRQRRLGFWKTRGPRRQSILSKTNAPGFSRFSRMHAARGRGRAVHRTA